MQTDRQGNALTGATREAAETYCQAIDAFNIYRGDPVALIDSAIAAAPRMVMAHIVKAWLYGLATEPAATAEARSAVETVRALPMDDRERSHVAALDKLLEGNWTAAALRLDYHSMRWPHDLVALQAGHLADFYRASARDLRDRIARALPKWSEEQPGYSILLGMHAFGLEETGDYGRAEAAGRDALARQPLDCWAHHAVAHVMEMQGRSEDGIGWMEAREPYWSGDDNFFQVHNWWHKALYHLDLGQGDAALALFDERIEGDKMIALDLVDASALLWRLHLGGHDVGNRWHDVASKWDMYADGRLYPFNDWHAAMAWLGAGRNRDVDDLVARYRERGNGTENARWAATAGLPLIEGFAAFWKGDYPTAVDRLHGARFIANSFGGSHAQRDVIDWTLTEAAIRGGLHDQAEAFANERLALKPHSPVNRRFLARAAKGRENNGIAA
ncbi:tetratricopeptide repeat protein [Oricola cellulosilytica]|uniref:Tetratricopeptide repeat protein 38 n=1 Tax=Oricola cellulosilytica TaxID=1429082 RepID=A0A4R0PB03_9HYPH|nr:tetratricopeptide repeat protein [Oricola cellulosilytica]TCD13475.1 tetratricopeptide repeat protein [Oricola cellulosilytica]